MEVKIKLKCVLLVDDDPDCNFFHNRLLTKMKCAEIVHSVHNGEEALHYLKNSTPEHPCPDIIFLDINMPRLNGFEFLMEYEKLPEEIKARTIIVMLTTSLNPDDKERIAKFSSVSGYKNKYLKKEDVEEVLLKHFEENFSEK